jgi:CheY-like chemotaxis protein
MTSHPELPAEDEVRDTNGQAIVTFSRDLFFGMRVRTIVRELGYDLTLTKSEAETLEALATSSPVLALVDFNQPVDWAALAPLVLSDVPVIGFSSHTDVDGFRAARAAGVDRVVSNGDFSRNLPELIEKYKFSPTR